MALSTASATAGRYNTLTFTSNGGETYSVSTNNLEILISGDNLSFNNTDIIIPLSTLMSMEFADYDDSPAGVDSFVTDGSGAVTVFTIDGTVVGAFGSYSVALRSLTRGIYVIKDENGKSIKVKVGK